MFKRCPTARAASSSGKFHHDHSSQQQDQANPAIVKIALEQTAGGQSIAVLLSDLNKE